MKISNVIDMELKFGIHVIAHKIYRSICLNNVSCEAVDLALKVVKKKMSFDLAELMLTQFNKNMDNIMTSKNNACNFGSHLTCLFFFVQKFFPSKGSVIWIKDAPVLYLINKYIVEMGENFVSIMDNYFDSFKKR